MSTLSVQPYLFFSGRCEEAIKFYQDAIGGVPGMLMRFNESPDPTPPGMLQDGFETKVMHAEMKIGEATLLLSDGCHDQLTFSAFRLAVTMDSEKEVREAAEAFAVGGSIEMPPTQTFWSPLFAMVTDKFGVGWMIMMAGDSPEQ